MGGGGVKTKRKDLEAKKQMAESGGYLNQAHKSPKNFTRERKMPFKKLAYFLLSK
jgi:hypothetical protein